MLAGQVYSTISCMLKGILFSPTICSLSEVGGFLDAEELHLSLCSISHSGIYGVYRARCFTHGPALYHGSPLALHPKHYATFQYMTDTCGLVRRNLKKHKGSAPTTWTRMLCT